MPGGFIGIAEECGIAQPLGEWTLHEACAQSRRWQAAGIAPVPVAVRVGCSADPSCPARSSILAMPKSSTLTVPSDRTAMLAGFRSR